MDITKIQELINKELPEQELIIGKFIAKGGFGGVYELLEPHKDKVIKIVENKEKSENAHVHAYRMQREFDINKDIKSSLDSPYLVKSDGYHLKQNSYDGHDYDVYLFVMQKMVGNFDTYKKMVGYSDEIAIQLGIQMAYAMIEYSKPSVRIVHRDIKPDNILVANNLTQDKKSIVQFQLSDFGISKSLSENLDSTENTWLVGTERYLPHEAMKKGRISINVDIFSLGAVLYEYANEDYLNPNYKYLENFSATPKNGSDELKRIIMKMIAFEPENRYQSPKELLDDFEKLQRENEQSLNGGDQKKLKKEKLELQEQHERELILQERKHKAALEKQKFLQKRNKWGILLLIICGLLIFLTIQVFILSPSSDVMLEIQTLDYNLSLNEVKYGSAQTGSGKDVYVVTLWFEFENTGDESISAVYREASNENGLFKFELSQDDELLKGVLGVNDEVGLTEELIGSNCMSKFPISFVTCDDNLNSVYTLEIVESKTGKSIISQEINMSDAIFNSNES